VAVVPGHEIVGEIVAVGAKVSAFKLGDRVGVGAQVWSCQEDDCHNCRTHVDNCCPRRVFTYNATYEDGAVAYGGYAERVRVSHHYAFRIPDTLSSEQAAPLLCAGVTTFAPLKRLGVGKGSRVGVLGIGGLGHLAIQFSAALGARVTAVSTEAEAKQLGATQFLVFSDAEAIKAAVGSFDVLVITSDQDDNNWGTTLSLLDFGGKLVLLALPDKPVPLPVGALVLGQKTIVGSIIGSRSETEETLAVAAAKGIKAWVHTLPMEQVNEGVQLVRENKARYRVVLTTTDAASSASPQ
jgi:D-arabinose 1-dehydrogenase-like Zn-dependent alcohol dehydrogenase